MIKTKESAQVVKYNGNRVNTITKKSCETELSPKDKKWISIVINSVPIGYIVCIVLGIGSWKQMFVYLFALCLSCLIGMAIPVRTYYNIAKKSILVCTAYIIVRAFIAVASSI